MNIFDGINLDVHILVFCDNFNQLLYLRLYLSVVLRSR